jgi:hypothetical protein
MAKLGHQGKHDRFCCRHICHVHVCGRLDLRHTSIASGNQGYCMSRSDEKIVGLKWCQFLAWTILTAMAMYELDAVWKVLAFMMMVWVISSISGLKTLAEIRRGVEALTESSRARLEARK